MAIGPIRGEAFEQMQHDALAYIREHVQQHGYPPTVREVGRRCGYESTSGAHNLLQKLVDRGLITVRQGTPRAMTITDAGMKELSETL